MEDFIIATASTCDLDKQWMEDNRVPFISYTFDIEGTVYVDDCTQQSKDILYAAMRQDKLPNTSQINVFAYQEFFTGLLSSGKPVIFADMSKAISGSYLNGVRAAELVLKEHPEGKLTVIDTRCVTGGLAMLLKGMVAQRDAGKSYEEVIAYAENTKLHIVHRFMIDELKWLQRGGRLSNATSLVGTLLSIKPLIYIPDDGSLVAFENIRGRKKAIKGLAEKIGNDIGDPSGKEIVLLHADCPEDAEKLKQMVLDMYPALGTITIMELGPVIGCHVGPGFLATVYMTEGKREQ